MRSGGPVEALERQELLGLDVEVLVMLGERLDQVVDVHEGERNVGALGLEIAVLGEAAGAYTNTGNIPAKLAVA